MTTDNRATEIGVLGNRVGHWNTADRPEGEVDAMPTTGNGLLFYGSTAVVTDYALDWEDVLAPGDGTDRGTRIREFTRTDPSEIVWDLDTYDPVENQIRWGIYGGARIANFRGGPGN